jgi:hypothetical protein
VREVNAVGSKWTKAVARSTPVPKCWQRKISVRWRGEEVMVEKRWEKRGKPHAEYKHFISFEC